ncbi:MAG: hypothetical protein COV72_00725 [Candidatus Omnitrophica bacterium CG11_big_fil_rev_8_21_14_0_20_42_13]|uniref:Holliday junction branch migration complex subunit RuvA n=1 Tax=Candidatus Ghiorseimicrobium undicola TaxID=1974746 RepID=A0A2H0LZQ5_9BACT|nr:MAG: hypothetical protein COV72_00725 [Candidatus Omnitrophica bacterium CG11_big_fil_rev_8_21_14_0_20_42_13]
MIIQVEGKLVRSGQDYLIVDIQGICYKILAAPILLDRLTGLVGSDGKIKLITYHYLQQDQSKSIPVLIGFLNEIEKEFFEIFITVSGIGPKAALKALIKPISAIAQSIDDGDVSALRSLPGIGPQRAREIIAKLQGKVGKYGLIQDRREAPRENKASQTIKDEALDILLQLQYKRSEAMQMIEKACERSGKIDSVEALLNEIYKQRKK